MIYKSTKSKIKFQTSGTISHPVLNRLHCKLPTYTCRPFCKHRLRTTCSLSVGFKEYGTPPPSPCCFNYLIEFLLKENPVMFDDLLHTVKHVILNKCQHSLPQDQGMHITTTLETISNIKQNKSIKSIKSWWLDLCNFYRFRTEGRVSNNKSRESQKMCC